MIKGFFSPVNDGYKKKVGGLKNFRLKLATKKSSALLCLHLIVICLFYVQFNALDYH